MLDGRSSMGSISSHIFRHSHQDEPSHPTVANESVSDKFRHNEETLAFLLNSVEDYAIFMLDPEGRVATWNPGAARIKGWSEAEIIGQHVSTFYTPEDKAAGRVQRLLREAATTGRVKDEGWRVRRDGTRFWADVIITRMSDKHGRLRGFAKVTRDLTEQRMGELRLRDSEEKFRLLVDNVVDYAIFMLDPTGHVVTWNMGAERLEGYLAREIVGQHYAIFYPDEDGSARCERELATAAQDGRFVDEGWRVRKDGSTFWANAAITALRDAKGELRGFANVTRDLTVSKHAEGERIRLAQAEEAIRLRDEFLSIASHELRTPLTALHLQLQNLRERCGSLDTKVVAKIDRATQSSNRLGELIDVLLDASRVVGGQLSLDRRLFDLTAVVGELAERFRHAAEGARCHLEVQGDAGVVGQWDRTRIEQVLTNLLSNALKYGAGHPVRMAVWGDESSAWVEVSDRGPGVAEADRLRIFGRFERAVSFRNYGGLGLGLYIAREIVEAHGGTIVVSGAPGGGATFRMKLPRHPEAVPSVLEP
jgi:PAS domain S-box-containing protein